MVGDLHVVAHGHRETTALNLIMIYFHFISFQLFKEGDPSAVADFHGGPLFMIKNNTE